MPGMGWNGGLGGITLGEALMSLLRRCDPSSSHATTLQEGKPQKNMAQGSGNSWTPEHLKTFERTEIVEVAS